jgi:GNAT superfamily N-acetyltransferase
MQTASAALAALAEDPDAFVAPAAGSERLERDGYCLTIGPERRWAGVCRLRLGPGAVPAVVAAIRAATTGIEAVVWNVGSSATPSDLAERLRGLGLHDPDPPLHPLVTALVLERAPPAVEGVDVRRVTTLAEHRAGLEIMLAASDWSERARADERARAEATFERRRRRESLQWLAVVDGEPVAWAASEVAAAGLYLAGGATLPAARGRGCYRALVRARYEEAARRGLAGLAVQAQHGTSAPILRRLGFADVAAIHTLQSPASG